MSFLAFILIVFSAVLHASWNLLGKRSTMSISFYTAMCITACMVWLHVQFWTPVNIFRLPGEFFLFLILSVVSDICYCLGLVRAYRTMEMSTAYPMMRALPLVYPKDETVSNILNEYMLGDNLLGGVGVGRDAFVQAYSGYHSIGAEVAEHSHNLYLQKNVRYG